MTRTVDLDAPVPRQAPKLLSETTTRVLRAVCARQPQRDLSDLLTLVEGDKHRLYDALLILEHRWLITWENHGKMVRPRQRGRDLLRQLAYQNRGLITDH